MRKALIGLILAATAMVPAAASAQRHHNDGDGDRSGWSGRNNGNGGNRGEGRAARSEARQQQQVQVQQPQQVQQQVVARQRSDGGNRGNWNRGGDNGAARGGWNRGGGDNGAAERGNWNRGGDDGNRRVRNNQQSVYPQAWQGNPNDPRLEHYRQLEQRNQNGGGRRDWRSDQGGRNDNWQGSRRGDRNGRTDWNRGWRNDNRYNWSSWRNQNRNRYHLSPYYSPYRNWSYQRFSIGLFLDSLFYDQRYWIGDPYDYRLPPAPYGTQWVRYYDDVILVDVYTGEVLDVIYDFFW